MAILNKPGSGTWVLNTGTFGANNTPAPTSLYMMEETTGQIVNNGVDVGSYDSDTNTADFTGAAATGDSFLAFTAANSDVVTWTASLWGITAYPFTFAAIVRDATDRGTAQAIVSIADASVGNVKYGLEFASNESANCLAQNTTQDNVQSGGVGNDGNWHLFAAVFNSATDRDVYLDGANTASDATSVTFNAGTDRAKLGARADSTESNYLEGDVAAVMIWNNAGLSAAQVQTDLWNAGDPWGFLDPAGGAPIFRHHLQQMQGY